MDTKDPLERLVDKKGLIPFLKKGIIYLKAKIIDLYKTINKKAKGYTNKVA